VTLLTVAGLECENWRPRPQQRQLKPFNIKRRILRVWKWAVVAWAVRVVEVKVEKAHRLHDAVTWTGSFTELKYHWIGV